MHIYLVRHIATEKNESGEIMGRQDLPILQSHTQHFTDLVSGFNLHNTQLVSSPQLRCQQTAQIIKNVFKLAEAKIDNRIQEVDMGGFTGKNYVQIKKEYPKEFETWIREPDRLLFPEGESMQQLQQRSWDLIEELISQSQPDSSYCLVTHVDVIKAIIAKLLNCSMNIKRLINIDNGSVSLLHHEYNTLKIKFLNATERGAA